MSEYVWRADLHTHTTASDGLDAPVQLIASSRGAGLQAIAIADHDTVAAHLELADHDLRDLRLIPAIEMSANVGITEVHVLGYFIDVNSQQLEQQLADLQRQRLDRIQRFCVRLEKSGIRITMDDVLAQATGESVGRPHIARAMIAKGYLGSTSEAFDRYLSGGRAAFVPRDDVTPESAIGLIHQSGGVAVFAHPYTAANPEQMIRRLLDAGLDGLEVEYGIYDQVQRGYLRTLAAKFGLIPTGGSDYHGQEHREDAPLGLGFASQDIVRRLEETAQQYR